MTGAHYTLIGLALVVGVVIWRARIDARTRLSTTYEHSLRPFRSNWSKVRLLLMGVIFISLPGSSGQVGKDDYVPAIGFSWIGIGKYHLPKTLIPGLPLPERWVHVLCLAGIYAIAATGLNLLIGFTGQISLAQSFFIGVGAYSIGYFGSDLKFNGKPMPFLLWLTIAVALGAGLSALIGPFALRLRGQYLAVVSIGLVVAGEWLFADVFTWITRGPAGRNDLPSASLTIWPGKTITFSQADSAGGVGDFFGFTFGKDAGYFWLIWAFVAVCALIAFNLLRSRQGRAMMAVRDRDLSAEIIGVKQAYTKVWAFAICGGMASLAGALYGSWNNFVQPDNFNTAYSIVFVAIIIVGGVSSVSGPIYGAVAIALLKPMLQRYDWLVGKIPFIEKKPENPGMTIDRFTSVIYGVLIILFLMFFPRGLTGLWERMKKYFATWPFSS
jgi:branched-chain amino acid transport system permease protein